MPIQKALVVDDSKSARFSIQKMLQKMSVGVDFAMSAEEAMAYLGKKGAEDQPDVIFMDHLMPGMDGFEATKAIKENSAWATIPVVMCTSKEGSEYLEQALSYGAIDILPKPASLKEISRILDQLGGTPNVKVSPSKTDSTPYSAISASMSRDAIEKLARDTANGVAKHTLEKLVAERLKQFRRELLIECESVAQKNAGEAIKKAAEEIQSDVVRLCKPQLTEIASDASQTESNAVFDTRFSDLSSQIMQQVNNQLAEIRTTLEEPHKPDPAFMEEVKKMACSVASDKGVESAEQVAADIATTTATDIAESFAEKKATEVVEVMLAPLEDTIKRSQRNSNVICAIAVIAAIVVYFLK